MEIQAAGRATFWWNMGTPGGIIQESNVEHFKVSVAERETTDDDLLFNGTAA